MRFKLLSSIGLVFLLSSFSAFAALDLQFTTTIAQSPDPASAGNLVTFTVSFKTFGGAVTNLKITGGVDGTQILDRTYASILADKLRTDSFTWPATVGNHTVWFELDPDHTCGDSNHTNNKTQITINVSGVNPPTSHADLFPTVVIDPLKLEEGKPMVLIISIKNGGNFPSVPCKGKMKEDGVETESKTIPSIEAEGEWKATVFRTVKCGAKFEIFVDTDNMNNESNEDNNTWTKIMKCSLALSEHPDLTTPDLTAPVNKQDPNGPDLTVKIVKIYKDANDLSGKTGFVTFEVENIGKAISALSTMEVKRGGVHEKTIAIPPLKVGEKFSGILREEYICGQQTTMKVDSNNENVEINESNNTAKKTIFCIQKTPSKKL